MLNCIDLGTSRISKWKRFQIPLINVIILQIQSHSNDNAMTLYILLSLVEYICLDYIEPVRKSHYWRYGWTSSALFADGYQNRI